MLRYFCTVAARPGTWADLGFEYYLALRQLAPTRVVPVGILGRGTEILSRPVAIVGGAEIVGRWEPHAAAFAVPVETGFINVVCGDGGALTHHYTVDVWNVAITAVMIGAPTAAQVVSLRRYDLVLCPTQEDVDALRDREVQALLTPADPDALGRAMKGMIQNEQ